VPLTVDAVGHTTPSVVHDVDSRWLMAYAASVGALDDAYLDTRRPGGIVGHPLFPVCVEWPAVLAVRDLLAAHGLTSAEAAHGVHLNHDLRLARLVRSGDRLSTTATIAGVTTHRAGGLIDLDLVTTDADGAEVARTRMGTLYRQVACLGADRPAEELPPLGEGTAPPVAAATSVHHQLGGGTAHLYSECSRIWNPIHTDARTAARAGLPGIILHGTATLAMAVNDVLADLDAEPGRVRRIRVRFGAPAPLPSALEVRMLGRSAGGDVAWFDAVSPGGRPVLRHGAIAVGPTGAGSGRP
jgi:acyl dehydratase